MTSLFDSSFYNALLQKLRQTNMFFQSFSRNLFHIMLHHDFHQLFKGSLRRIPAKFALSFGRIPPKIYDIRRTVEVWANLYYNLSRSLVDAILIHPFASEFQFNPSMMERQLTELTHRMLHTCCNDKILRLIVLQNQPHAFHIILGIAPITQAVEIAEIQLLLVPLRNTCRPQRNLTRYKSFPTALRLMVKENAGSGEHIIGLTIFLRNPEAILFGNSIRRIRMEWRVFILGNFLHFAVKLRCGCLINTTSIL